VQVGTLNETVLLPFGKVRFRSKSIFVPQPERVRRRDLERRGIRASRVNDHVRISRRALCDRYTRSGGFQRRRDCGRVSAAVVLQHDIHINAVVAIDDAVVATNRRANELKVRSSDHGEVLGRHATAGDVDRWIGRRGRRAVTICVGRRRGVSSGWNQKRVDAACVGRAGIAIAQSNDNPREQAAVWW
jgi:predicted RNA-binding protein YlqC (UPF0109 family)